MCRLKKINIKKFIFYILISSIIIFFVCTGYVLSSCSLEQKNDEKSKVSRNDKTIEPVRIVYAEWDSEIASSYVLKAVIEKKLGYKCELLAVTLTSLWESVAAGDMDVMVAAWLPSLHQHHQQKYRDHVVNLGPNLEGTKSGLVVPEYIPINSIEQLREFSDKFNGNIIGIEPDSGIMKKTREVMVEYNLKNKFDLIPGSDSTMTTILKKALAEKKWVVITGWTPHWMFAKWNLKYLKDPKNIYGGKEHISTIVRKGLKRDRPDVYEFLDKFYWDADDMQECMLMIEKKNMTPEDAALKWINNNKTKVKKWFAG
ncbi:MAG: glycine betaine ABC transporter substrate-binding protein [Candidatus Mcinerneyibacterium aminivorans]|uniref:Glycine betaine ABC transporter substrate-binding protein n=1 Tax=Candidatus Mcinerneyibacterium aminivorans TaxID=2703815 RepID=A0A5D0MNB0_9BACT|nr:MAG: glycine betaine ABC transporter substrate-binding protein [Candidatus Mcinerneyibacterium aminivorans]